ncbi:hypothetical protein HanIR_Chr14g0692961 [Helianthus annuus]|nr:hypothetical protein HanIR_Chr14g0692961 [Helianthus annuus]
MPSIYAFSFRDLLEQHNIVGFLDLRKEAVQGIIMIGCWSIWKARNEFKFSDRPVKIENINNEMKALGFF